MSSSSSSPPVLSLTSLPDVSLTPSGRAELHPGEVEISLTDSVSFEVKSTDKKAKTPPQLCKDGICVLTNQRLLWLPKTPSLSSCRSYSMELRMLAAVSSARSLKDLSFGGKVKLEAHETLAPYASTSKIRLLVPSASVATKLVRSIRTAIDDLLHQDKKQQRPKGPVDNEDQRASTRVAVGGGHLTSPVTTTVVRDPSLSTSVPEVDDALLAQLVDMGFENRRAVEALRREQNDLRRATELLLSGVELQVGGASLASHPLPLSSLGKNHRQVSEHSSSATPPKPAAVGLQGLLLREERRQQHRKTTVNDAMSDLGSLMDKAKEVVKIVEAISRRVGDTTTSSSSSGGGGSGGGGGEGTSSSSSLTRDERELMAQAMTELGIVSPVTRQTAGSLYEEQLARQLYDFLCGTNTTDITTTSTSTTTSTTTTSDSTRTSSGTGKKRSLLDKFGGLMPLTEIWYWFNRARGLTADQELVSPQDLKDALVLMPKLGLSARQIALSSGIVLVEAGQLTHEVLCGKLVDMAKSSERDDADRRGGGGGLGIMRAAEALGVGTEVARELLFHAEGQGNLCRDESAQGVKFYPNRFRV